jgi:hypothetical protein
MASGQRGQIHRRQEKSPRFNTSEGTGPGGGDVTMNGVKLETKGEVEGKERGVERDREEGQHIQLERDESK